MIARHRQGKGACRPLSGSRMAAGLEQPAIERGQPTIVISHNSSELTGDANLTWGSGHQGSRHEAAWASFTLATHAGAALQN